MKVKTIPSVLLGRDGRRMDSAPYMSGSQETKLLIERLDAPKAALRTLTRGYDGGIYNGPKFARNWVQAPEHGVPFLNSSDMLQADLTNLPYLRKSDAHSPRLSYLRLAPGMILISCTGTIGRMVYARPDMDGIWSSQHIMKVVPDPAHIPPGYLYAYLSSKYGVPMIVGGTYGSIIQSIEPHHIADLPVPRLGEAIEQRAHALVEEAAQLRSEAAQTIRSTAELFDRLLTGLDLRQVSPRISYVTASKIQSRFDAQYHDPIVLAIRQRIRDEGFTTIGEWCEYMFLPGIFKRIHIENPEYGAPYYTGASLFWLEPLPKAILSRKTSLFSEVQIKEGMILVQAFGQEGGLTGRAVWVSQHLNDATTTHMLVRLIVPDLIRAAFLFGYLQSETAYRQIACLTYGGSIPHLDEHLLASVLMPKFKSDEIMDIGTHIIGALNSRDRALSLEIEARALVEHTIEGFA